MLPTWEKRPLSSVILHLPAVKPTPLALMSTSIVVPSLQNTTPSPLALE
jgi:hypothetical protein